MRTSPIAGHSGWRTIAALTFPYRGKVLAIAFFALLATGTGLLAPLIYREAVNDIAGLFVGAPVTKNSEAGEHQPSGEALAVRGRSAADNGKVRATSSSVDKKHRHGRHHLAPRTPEQTLQTLLLAVALLFLISIFSHYCELVSDQKTVRLASRIEADYIHGTFNHVLKLPLRFFARRSSGSLSKQIDQSDVIAPIVTAIAQEIAPAIITMVGIITIMFMQSWRLTIAAIIVLPVYVWIVFRSSKQLETGLTRYYEMWDGVSSRIQEALGAIKTVKLSGAEAREARQLHQQSREAYQTYVERNRLANRYIFLQSSLSYFSQALVLAYGGWLVFEHGLTPGDVVMFVVYLERLYAPIESLTSLSVTLQEHFASLQRAIKLKQEPGEETGGASPLPGPGRVEFRNVHFGYTAEREILTGLSLVLEPGRMTAIVGPSGAGKTTTADLMLKLFEINSGEILLDGQPVNRLDAAAVRREFGVVAADGAIFRGTISDNIRYKRPEATQQEVYEAAQAAGLFNTLERFPLGLATEIGEGGAGLSVGERQRLQIARAFAGKPRILVLDEATANLDYATESGIRKALLSRTSRSTTLVITHRYAMAEICDHVIVLQAGQVMAQGAPEQLLKDCAWFAEFAASSAIRTTVSDAGSQAEPSEGDDSEGEDDEDDEDEGAVSPGVSDAKGE